MTNDPVSDVVALTVELVTQLRQSELFPESLRASYARFVRDNYGAQARKLGFTPRAGESDDARAPSEAPAPGCRFR